MAIISGAELKGVSVALPKETLDVSALYPGAERTVQFTGIKKVRLSPPDKIVSDYGVAAAENLFEKLSFDRERIDGIIFISPVSDYLTPGTSGVIQRRLKLKKHLPVFDINQGCTGFVYGLFQASLLVQAGVCQNVLVCCGDTPTKYINENDRALRMSGGDGGAAFLVGAGTKKFAFDFFTDGYGLENLYMPAGGFRMPKKPGVTDVPAEDEEGNVRTLENMNTVSIEVMRFDLNNVGERLNSVLAQAGMTKDEIEYFFFHQSGAFILNRMVKKYKLDPAKVPLHMEDTGTLGAASIPMAMCRTFSEEVRGRFSKVALCAFGAGLSAAAAVVDFSGTEFLPVDFV